MKWRDVLMLAWHGNIGLTPFWLISMVWSTLAIKAYNRQFERPVSGR